MTRARSRRTARRKIKRLIRKTLKIVCAVWDFIARHPAMLAMPLIIFLLVLTIQMHEFEKQVQAWDQEIRQQQEQIEELYDRQDPVEQTDMTDVYGCKSLYGTYDFPWNTMSQDWGSDQVTGFYYHEISEECKASGDQLEVEIYPEFTKGQKDQIPDEGKRKRQRQAQKNLNDKNSKKMCERVISENFTDRDIWATFTYTDDNMPASMEVATKNMQNYIRRLNYQRKKQGLSNARYVYVTECSEKGRWHHHIVMDGDVDMDTVEAVWNLGKRNEIRRLQRDENGLVGMARYITKEKSKKGKYQKTWCASKGLRKPKEKVNHYKTKQKDVDRIVKGDLNVCDHLMKWYGDKYDFAEAEVKYNTFNGRFYIYGRMRLRKGTAHDKGKK